MGRDVLLGDEAAAAALDRVQDALAPLVGFDVRATLLGDPAAQRLDRIEVVQPLQFALQVCLTEALAARGVVPDMYALGRIPEEALEGGASGPGLGLECAGVVSAVGEGVTDLHPGDRVCCLAGGCYDSQVLAAAQTVFPLPDSLDFAAAATIPVAHFTAYYALTELARLAEGESILIHGGAGGVGLAAIQLARQLGANVMERGGVNSNSPLPDSPEAVRAAAAALPEPEPYNFIPDSLRIRVRDTAKHHFGNAVLLSLFPHYHTHRPYCIARELVGWIPRYFTLSRRRRQAVSAAADLFAADVPFFLFPLQLDADMTVRGNRVIRSGGRFRGACGQQEAAAVNIGQASRGFVDVGAIEASAGTRASALPLCILNYPPQRRVTTLYQELLGRKPDPSGLQFWVGRLEQGASIPDIRKGILQSPESEAAIKTALRRALRRDATSQEVAAARQRLMTGTPLTTLQAAEPSR